MKPLPPRLAAALLILPGSLVADTDDWYPFTPDNRPGPSRIGMEAWNPEPAGARGWIERDGSRLRYDGRELKLWGINNTYSACAPERELADRRAHFYRKFGFNSIRLHKYADGPKWAGIQSERSAVEFDPAKLAQMDYFIHALKEHGIFTKLSPTFGVKFGSADAERFGPWLTEFGDFDRNDRLRAPFGSVFIAREVQDIQIAQTVRLLEHVNPHTERRYAVEPAIYCIELFNEDSVLFGGVIGSMRQSPTLRRRTAREFSSWLMEKYGSDEAWREAWGAEAIFTRDGERPVNSHLRHMIGVDEVRDGLPDESIARRTVAPWCQPWFGDRAMDPDTDQAFLRQRLLDSMRFLIGKQDEFYDRYAQAIRDTGYEGLILTSNWQAGSLVGHLLNLHSDARFDIVDRHNYFGGGRNALDNKQPFKDGSMLAIPGKGTLSAGFQQVADRPFMLSEWIHVGPSEWGAEGPAILGAYGWGLQGWDVSYIFQNRDDGGFRDRLGQHPWDAAAPQVMGIMAAVSRQVRRMDVAESEDTIALPAPIEDVRRGELDFTPTTTQAHDEKTFSTAEVPPGALAVKRVAVDFDPAEATTPEFSLNPHYEGGAIVSSTGQLRWWPAAKKQRKGGWFTVASDGTKSFTGFGPGDERLDLGDGYAIRPGKGFAAIHLTAKGPGESLAETDEIVLVAIARARNTGMTYNDEGKVLTAVGEAPVRLEPVSATLELPFAGTLVALDHDGREPIAERDFDGRLELDTAEDRTPFYVIRRRSEQATE